MISAMGTDDSLSTGDDTFDVAGYFQCVDCHRWVVEGMEVTSARLCSDCSRRRAQDAATTRLNYEVEGRRFSMGPTQRPQRRQRRGNAESERHHALRSNAWAAAMSRLIVIHRPLFDILYAEEKARRGLNPKLRSGDLPAREIAQEVLGVADREMTESVERVRDVTERRERSGTD